MSKGAKNPKYKPTQETPLVTTGYQGMGYTPTPQTWNQESKPAWMQGAWDMPNWGQAASQTGAPPQAELNPMAQAAPPQQQVQAPATPGKAAMLQAMRGQQDQQQNPYAAMFGGGGN